MLYVQITLKGNFMVFSSAWVQYKIISKDDYKVN